MTRPLAVVTGASRGIGRAIALRLAPTHDVLAMARTRADLETLAKEIEGRGGQCRVAPVDLRDSHAIGSALQGVDADVVVNNAGLGPIKPMTELTPDEWNAMVDVNFNALF